MRVSRYGPGQRDFDGTFGALADELELVDGEGAAAAEATEDDGVADLCSGHVEGAEFPLERVRVVDHGGEIAEGDELGVVEEAADEAGVAVAALLAVGQHVNAGAELGVDAEADGVVGGGLVGGLAQPALEAVVDGLEHPAGAGPAADAHDGEGRDGGRWARRRESVGDGHRHPLVDGGDGDRSLGGGSALGQRALADEEAALDTLACPGDDLVAGEAAPRRQLDLDGGVGGEDLQQATALQRVDMAADEQQQAAAAVEVAAVQADVWVCSRGARRGP